MKGKRIIVLVAAAVIATSVRPAVDYRPFGTSASVPAKDVREFGLPPLEPHEQERLELMFAAKAAATPTHTELDAFASGIARRAIKVACPSSSEWRWHRNLVGKARGYVASVESAVAWLAPDTCTGALAVVGGDAWLPAWKRAMGVLVLTHESLHLRRWRHAENEAAVQCAAIQRFKRSVGELGETPGEAQDLWPWALALHWWIARQNDTYWWKRCAVSWF